MSAVAEDHSQNEDVVAKYKRLLTLARSSLEANQISLLEKDKTISQLKNALDEEKQKLKIFLPSSQEDDTNIPKCILRRVDIDESIWVLLQYSAPTRPDSWMRFKNIEELEEYIQCIPGVPLVIPHRCLTSEESNKIVSAFIYDNRPYNMHKEIDCKQNVDRIVEEFRRYKVRSEISKKQKDAEIKHSSSRPSPHLMSGIFSSSSTLPSTSTIDRAMTESALGYISKGDAQNHSAQVNEGTTTLSSVSTPNYKALYESLVKEIEHLRNRQSESALTTQWRERYETCLREKEDVTEKLKIFSYDDEYVEKEKTLKLAYAAMKADFKKLKKKYVALEAQSTSGRDRDGGGNGSEKVSALDDSNDGALFTTRERGSNASNSTSTSMQESKWLYMRHLILQYLSCKDDLVRGHMESAVVKIFRYNEQEKALIKDRLQSQSIAGGGDISDSLGISINSLISSFGIST